MLVLKNVPGTAAKKRIDNQKVGRAERLGRLGAKHPGPRTVSWTNASRSRSGCNHWYRFTPSYSNHKALKLKLKGKMTTYTPAPTCSQGNGGKKGPGGHHLWNAGSNEASILTAREARLFLLEHEEPGGFEGTSIIRSYRTHQPQDNLGGRIPKPQDGPGGSRHLSLPPGSWKGLETWDVPPFYKQSLMGIIIGGRGTIIRIRELLASGEHPNLKRKLELSAEAGASMEGTSALHILGLRA